MLNESIPHKTELGEKLLKEVLTEMMKEVINGNNILILRDSYWKDLNNVGSPSWNYVKHKLNNMNYNLSFILVSVNPSIKTAGTQPIVGCETIIRLCNK